MGDITPKPKPAPEPPPNDDQALGEAPGSSVTMPDIPGWNAETPEPTPPPKGYFPPVDLVEAWRRAAGQASPEPEAAPTPEPEASAHGHPAPASNRLLILLSGLGLLVVAGLGGAYYTFFRTEPLPEHPVAVTTASPKATPTPRPTPSRTPRPSTAPVPPAPGPPGAPKTYTVLPGDTLITIGEKLGKDWRQIAAANGQITDPNFITPGQVLVIP